jgi:superfamily II DNA/RNA helicase
VTFYEASPALVRALEERNYIAPTPVQAAVLANEAQGGDILVSAQTGEQFVAHVIALSGNPDDGHTLANVIPAMEKQIDASVTRIVVDRGYRGGNAPLSHPFRVFIAGRKRRVTEAIKRELKRRSAIAPATRSLLSSLTRRCG